MSTAADKKTNEALSILGALGLPKAQQNDRSALCLLALVDLKPHASWADCSSPLMGITPIMDWVREQYERSYAPNTRETFRRQSMHQFVAAGIALYNPDDPNRAVNSPAAAYQISPETLALLRRFGTVDWDGALKSYLETGATLAARYAQHRDMKLVPVKVAADKSISLSPGAHSELIGAIVSDFAPRFLPGAQLIYVGDTGSKTGYFDEPALSALGVQIDSHGKFPDVVFHFQEKNWLVLIESVTSHGPVDGKRHAELSTLFSAFENGLVFVTAFPSRKIMAKYLPEISWETEVWCAEAPTHLIHFNGERFLGPYTAGTN